MLLGPARSSRATAPGGVLVGAERSGRASASLLSDWTTAPEGFQYNRGEWFPTSIDSRSYNLGSIDLYNYTYADADWSGPFEYTEAPWDTPGWEQAPGSNVYLRAATAATGGLEWEISLEQGIRLTVVVRGQ